MAIKIIILVPNHFFSFSSSSGSIVLESLALDGCKNLTSLDDIFGDFAAADAGVTDLRVGLKNLTVTRAPALETCRVAGFRHLRRLDLRHCGVARLHLDAALPSLEDVDLSGNAWTHFDASDVIGGAPNLKTLALSNCTNLESVILSSPPAARASGLLVNLVTLILDDNPNLVSVCPWFLRSAPNIATVSMERCPRLGFPAATLSDTRFFPALQRVGLAETSLACDCDLLQLNRSHVNVELAQSLQSELRRRKVCSHNGTDLSVDAFFSDPARCRFLNRQKQFRTNICD
jgi:hypothetical protein